MNVSSFFLLLSCVSFSVFAIPPCIAQVFNFLLEQNSIRSTSPVILDIFDPSKDAECLKVPRCEPVFSCNLLHDITQTKENNLTVDKIQDGSLFESMQKMIDARNPDQEIDINELKSRLSTITMEPLAEEKTPEVRRATSTFIETIYNKLLRHNKDVKVSGFMEMVGQANDLW